LKPDTKRVTMPRTKSTQRAPGIAPTSENVQPWLFSTTLVGVAFTLLSACLNAVPPVFGM